VELEAIPEWQFDDEYVLLEQEENMAETAVDKASSAEDSDEAQPLKNKR